MGPINRRDFLSATAAAPLAAAVPSAGLLRHAIPTASHDRILLKTSFTQPLDKAPSLRVGGTRLAGTRTDTAGAFWSFDARGLKPATSYELQIHDHRGKPVSDAWQLRTLPHPDDPVSRFRLLIYTCAGGHDGMKTWDTSQQYWVSLAHRRKLLLTGLAQRPDAVIANGDHIYWDLRFGRASGRLPMGATDWAKEVMGGEFDRSIPVIGTANEAKLIRASDPQIADLYGTILRGVPSFFIQDDHDYFENDEAIPAGISFPPDDFMLRLARSVQSMYYPEFLPDAGRPAGLAATGALSECYGTLRFGKLAEILMYDCRRFMTLKGPHGGFVPDTVEAWLTRRMKASPAEHVVNVPSTPIGWTAGKWGEWYPDLLGDDGRVGVSKPKYFWQEGWKLQHDRLVAACSAMERIPLFISGDLHALGHGAIEQCGKLDLRRNPVHTVLSGPISTGPRGWPSAARGTPPQVAFGLGVVEDLKPLENNGFTIVDFLPGRIEFQMYKWKMDQPESLLADLRPFHKFELKRLI